MFRLALLLTLASAKGSCDDLGGWETENGKGCSWIGKDPGDRCSEVGETSADVAADRVCVACGNVDENVAAGVRSLGGPSSVFAGSDRRLRAAAGRLVGLRVQGLRLGRE